MEQKGENVEQRNEINGKMKNDETKSHEKMQIDLPSFSSIYNCSICKENVSAASAKILNCSHTVCVNCVTKIEDGFIVCGFCKQKWNLDTIDKHFLIEAVEENDKTKICLMCTENLVANYHCVQCTDDLCVNCVEAHKRVKVTKGHDLQKMFEVNSPLDTCPLHKNHQLLWHCKNCNEITCPSCQLENHEGHSYQPAADGVAKFRNEIRQGNEKNNAAIKNVFDFTCVVEKRIHDVEDCKRTLEKQIEESTKVLHDAVQYRHDFLIKCVKEKCKLKFDQYDAVRKSSENVNYAAQHLKLLADLSEKCHNKLPLRRCTMLLAELFANADDAKTKLLTSSSFVHNNIEIELQLRKPVEDLVKTIKEYGEIVIKGEEDPSALRTHYSCATSPMRFSNDNEVVFLGTRQNLTPINAAHQNFYILRPLGSLPAQTLPPGMVPLQQVSLSHQFQGPHLAIRQGSPVITAIRYVHPQPLTSTPDDPSSQSRKRKISPAHSAELPQNSEINQTIENLDSRRLQSLLNTYGKPRPTNNVTPQRQKNPGDVYNFDEGDQETESNSRNPSVSNSPGVLRPLFKQSADSVQQNGHAAASSDTRDNEEKEWEEFCSVCGSDEGDFLKCSARDCTRIFHRYDHVPSYSDDHSFTKREPFVCGFCRNPSMNKQSEDSLPKEKRVSSKMTPYERQVAERILLELYCNAESVPFHKLDDDSFNDQNQLVSRPIALANIRQHLETDDRNRYSKIESLIVDLNQIFINCATVYDEKSDVGEKGKTLGEFYRSLVDTYLPTFSSLVDFSKAGERSRESLRKRRKTHLDYTSSDTESM